MKLEAWSNQLQQIRSSRPQLHWIRKPKVLSINLKTKGKVWGTKMHLDHSTKIMKFLELLEWIRSEDILWWRIYGTFSLAI